MSPYYIKGEDVDQDSKVVWLDNFSCLLRELVVMDLSSVRHE